MAFERGSLVVYGVHGVCEVVEIELRIINRKKVEYYVLQPREQPESRFYVPTQNEAAVSKMTPILTREGVSALLRGESITEQSWIEDENQRKQYYKTLICSGDRAALMGMIRQLYIHKKQQQATGRKFHLCDENFLRDAERLIGGEVALVLDIPRSQVGEYIRSVLEESAT